jgi:hypothetical protein
MKNKYVVGLFAVVLAIGFSSFTEISKMVRTSDTYHFIGADFSHDAVVNPANWDKSVSSGTGVSCGGAFTTITCSITLPAGYNDGDKLDGTQATIVPIQNGSYYKVSDVTDGSTILESQIWGQHN